MPARRRVPAHLRGDVTGLALTDREWECLVASAHGGRKHAAYALGVSPQTVANHLTNIYRKLNVASVVEAYVAVGWLHLPGDEDRVRADVAAHNRRLQEAVATVVAEAKAITLRYPTLDGGDA